MFEFVVFFVVLAGSAMLTGFVRYYALKRGLIDTPNARSSHDVPTPRGGGLGIVIVLLCAVLVLGVIGKLDVKAALAIGFGSSLIAIVGFVDDHRSVSASWRFMVQVVAAAAVVSALGGLPDIQVGDREIDLGWLGDSLAVFFMVWFTNAFNFMDGIDGLAASETICIVGGALLVLLLRGNCDQFALLVMIAASTLGFLVWNWPPAKIFMGDVGSAFLGFVLIAVAILTSRDGSVSIWSWLILGGVFIVDATITLLVRMIKRENWLLAHRSHAYQHAARRYDSHKIVTVAVILINVAWLFPLSVAASAWPELGWWVTAVSLAPLVWVSLRLGAGTAG